MCFRSKLILRKETIILGVQLNKRPLNNGELKWRFAGRHAIIPGNSDSDPTSDCS